MTKIDQIIEEVRQSRRRMSKECGHDPKRLIQLLQGYNRRYAAQVKKYRRARRRVATSAPRPR